MTSRRTYAPPDTRIAHEDRATAWYRPETYIAYGEHVRCCEAVGIAPDKLEHFANELEAMPPSEENEDEREREPQRWPSSLTQWSTE